MNNIEELKQFVVLHARAQGITAAKYQAVLDQVKSDRIRGWAIPASLLAGIEIPVSAIVSSADEIIPPGDARILHEHIRDLRLMENDDIHGSPRRTTATRLWTLLSVMRMQPGRRVRQALVGSALTGVRIRQRLTMAGVR
jgi:hypothetical protein